MAIMELSNPKDKKIFCQMRREWIQSTPEERVRQTLLRRMNALGYPQSHLVLEASLSQMPHLALFPSKLPNRRADLVCFAPHIHPQHALYPLLLIECKAIPLTSKVINQVLGYNHYLQAYFIAIINQDTVKTGWYDTLTKSYLFRETLPHYQELISALK